MAKVSSAIHVRTGQRSAAAAVDDWLARHAVAVTGFADVYDACVHLLRQYERIPDLAFLGADWLADDEFALVAQIRQTWPQTGIIVYAGAAAPVRVDLLPLTATYYGPAALDALLAETPNDLACRLSPHRPSGTGQRTRPAGSSDHGGQDAACPHGTGQGAGCGPRAPGDDPPDLELPSVEWSRSVLTAEELSALLDRGDED